MKAFSFTCICYHKWGNTLSFNNIAIALYETQFIPRKNDFLAIEHGTEIAKEGTDKVVIGQTFLKVKTVTIDPINLSIEVLIDSETEIEYE